MPLLARDQNGELVSAYQVLKTQTCRCIECDQPVRARGGPQRHLHFYHTKKRTVCRQAGKTATHLRIQLHLLSRFPADQASIEHPFPEINRVADVVWYPHKIVFEIQCSSITAWEVAKRNADYASIGYYVVWILHRKRFTPLIGKTGAQVALQARLHYYTTIDSSGRGAIFDPLSTRNFPLKVDLSHRIDRQPLPTRHWHPRIRNRALNSTFCFKGDALDLAQSSTPQQWLFCSNQSIVNRLTQHLIKIRKVVHNFLDSVIRRGR